MMKNKAVLIISLIISYIFLVSICTACGTFDQSTEEEAAGNNDSKVTSETSLESLTCDQETESFIKVLFWNEYISATPAVETIANHNWWNRESLMEYSGTVCAFEMTALYSADMDLWQELSISDVRRMLESEGITVLQYNSRYPEDADVKSNAGNCIIAIDPEALEQLFGGPSGKKPVSGWYWCASRYDVLPEDYEIIETGEEWKIVMCPLE